ncbi:MAG: hypothetical protein ACE5FS_05015 [Paracoccaceae bacterium]
MWGATILAGLLFFVLNVGAGLIIERDTLLMALLSGTLKAVIFAALFHYSHNWLAGWLGWYEKDE